MVESSETRSAESTPEQPVQADSAAPEDAALARGSGHLTDVASAVPERTEHSIVEGLPAAKAERIAAMRRELAELQRQLSEAQQRIATELQGRAEDAERLEVLEARVQAHDVKEKEEAARNAEQVSEVASLRSLLANATSAADDLRRDVDARMESLNETKTRLEVRDGELAGLIAARDAEQAAKSRLERELEDQRKQHGEVTGQLESQVASLREQNAVIATRDAELAAMTTERDALKGEVASVRARLREVGGQLARLGQEMTEGDSNPAIAVKTIDRPKPPPVPARITGPQPKQVEPILEVTAEPSAAPRSAVWMIGGAILGCLATIAVVSWTGSSSAIAEPDDHAAVPPAQLAAEPTTAPAQPVAVPAVAPPSAPISEAVDDSASHAAPAADGTIVLPQEAADHRVYVDGKVVAVKGSRAVVPCGVHEIRIGSHGASRKLDVACGGETTVPAEPRER